MAVARLFIDTGPLRHSRQFRRLWTGYVFRQLGAELTATAVIYQTYIITHSNLDVGFVSLAQLGPALLIPIVSGAITDAVDRRKLLLVMAPLIGAATAGLAINASGSHPALWPVFVCAAAIQGFNSIDSPTRSAVIPAIVDRDSLVAANALSQLLWQLSSMAGPAFAGLLIATTHGNIALVYWIDVASTAIALLSVARLPPLPPSGGGRKFGLSSIAEGFSFLAGRQVIQGSLLADWLATVLGEPVSLFPYMALVRFHGGPTAFGILAGAPAIGAALGSLLSGWANRVRRPGRAVLYALVAWGVAITAFGVSPWFWLAVVAVGAAGWADAVSVLFRTTIVQLEVPDQLRGRLFSIQSAVVVSGPRLGNVEGGLIAAASSAPIAIVVGGLGCLLAAAGLNWLMPSFARYELEGHAQLESAEPGAAAT